MEQGQGKVPPPDKIPPITVKGTINSYAIGSKISRAGYTVSVVGEKNKTVITVYTDQAREAALAILRRAGCVVEE